MLQDHPEFDDHARVTFVTDPETGLRAIHAIHRPVAGRSGGGIRFRAYASEGEALSDVLRLSRAMTYKMALAGIPVGGAKSVIIGDPKLLKTPGLLAAFARYIESLNGAYFGGPDIGTDADDMVEMAKTTRFVAGRADQSGTTAVPTATGTYHALRATAKTVFGSDDLSGLRIAVQGAGGVGGALIARLLADGAQVVATDINAAACDAAKAKGAEIASPDAILGVKADILSPCALGGILTPETIAGLQVRAICGCANNQLAAPGCADLLAERGVIWAPDYVVSAGGVIDGAKDAGWLSPDERDARLEAIGPTLERIFAAAREKGNTTEAAAKGIALEALAEACRADGTVA